MSPFLLLKMNSETTYSISVFIIKNWCIKPNFSFCLVSSTSSSFIYPHHAMPKDWLNIQAQALFCSKELFLWLPNFSTYFYCLWHYNFREIYNFTIVVLYLWILLLYEKEDSYNGMFFWNHLICFILYCCIWVFHHVCFFNCPVHDSLI